ncbi:alkaline phosphatase family protein [Pseudoalteromonas sp. McH1-7]|uniref:alkaline phosphatase family protein n=1 Tax=Pseudoalteromonas TaxID=53246 RepID=UPI0015901EF7|nr:MULTISPECIES: alkaline phosphatase family protein [Pseudoalteromonas]MDW7549158.1 alkaline phosphatase family protein [Pseudoalteromonas peptidolytica]NUZ09958.1 alkaline phosphatase family protein [Pseudoalteromonas sp. McH1-7]USD30971.1 alkaline phosphatase family protein [Pseudoalteromonas sp. SCSIO 43201]
MKLPVLRSALLALSFTACANALENKVLLIGIDGLQYEKIGSNHTPNFDRLFLSKAYTGGLSKTQTQQKTKSGPGWATILTGVWVNKHQVPSNDSGLANNAYRSLYRYIAEHDASAHIASFSTWGPIHSQFFRRDLGLMKQRSEGGSDDDNLNKALATLNNDSADFVFLHLDEPDAVGHALCFGSAYNKAVEDADKRLGKLLDAVEAKERKGENWLVMVTTDHGRTPIVGCHHGEQTEPEKTIFIASNKRLNKEFSSKAVNPANTDFSGLYGYPAQTAIVPTILSFMGIETGVQAGFESTSLYGDVGIRKLNYANKLFTWLDDAHAPTRVYRNNQLLETLPAGVSQWQDSAPTSGINDYSFEQQGVYVGYRVTELNLTAAHQWHNTKSYFFSEDARYWRYDTLLDKTDDGYPVAVTDGNWPGLAKYAEQIQASFYKDRNTVYYFLSTGLYLSYDVQNDRVRTGYPKAIDNSSWPGLAEYANKITATLRWTSDKVYFFLNDGRYLRYDLGDDSVDSGYPKAINDSTWPGVGDYASKISAALKWNSTRAYFFLDDGRYLRYSITLDKVDPGYPKVIDNGTWPGLQ